MGKMKNGILDVFSGTIEKVVGTPEGSGGNAQQGTFPAKMQRKLAFEVIDKYAFI